jgi:hypothetical protein
MRERFKDRSSKRVWDVDLIACYDRAPQGLCHAADPAFFVSHSFPATICPLHDRTGLLGRPRISNSVKSRCYVDAVSHQVAVALLDDIANVDADTKLNPPIRWKARVALEHTVLHLDGAAHSIDHASELDEDSISCPLGHATVMHSDCKVDEITLERPQARNCPFLVGTASLLHPATPAAKIAASLRVSVIVALQDDPRLARLAKTGEREMGGLGSGSSLRISPPHSASGRNLPEPL